MSPLPQSIHLEIVTPEQRLVNEIVDEVVLPGSQGSLGVLPGHTPLLSTLGIGWLMYRRGDLRRYLAIAWGFAEVLPDRVGVLAEIAERAESIDRERARQARDRALERLRGRGPGTDFERAQIALQKAVIRIQVADGAGPNEPA
ncbi:MAG TPA: F0F1 ATP synthase subunit epsilon [Candidatus Dormibacteraeota bacterium]|nr:F0F1 ATP synthase subunit epsilon [Candidatus Dormibacteraeota bacterium]